MIVELQTTFQIWNELSQKTVTKAVQNFTKLPYVFRRFQQSGFTSGHSMLDAILALRLLSEVHRNWLALWKALWGIGIPQYLLQLIEDLHNGSTSSVRSGANLSPSFLTTSSVRQGYVLTPALFCRAIDWIMQRVVSRTGFSLGNATLLTWIMQMTLASLLTKWMTSMVPWRSLRQQHRNSAYIYLGTRRRSRIWVRVNLHLAHQFAATLWKK